MKSNFQENGHKSLLQERTTESTMLLDTPFMLKVRKNVLPYDLKKIVTENLYETRENHFVKCQLFYKLCDNVAKLRKINRKHSVNVLSFR